MTLQLLRSMNAMWREAGVPVILTTYRCAPTWDLGGLVEVVTNADTVATIQTEMGGKNTGAFSDDVM